MTVALAVDGDPHQRPYVGAADLRAVMRHHVRGVAVVTTGVRGAAGSLLPVGCTVTSLVSVSLVPPLVSFSLRAESRLERAWRGAEYGVVHLLHDGQHGLADRFAGDREKRFADETPWHWDGPCPVLDDALGRLTVRPYQRVTAGDHVILVATVISTELADPLNLPLVHHDGGYAGVGRRLGDNPGDPA